MEFINNQEKWWEAPKGTVHKLLFGHINHLDNFQSSRSEKNLAHLRMYGDCDVLGINKDLITAFHTVRRSPINMIKRVIESAQAKIAKHKPEPNIITESGNSIKQSIASKLEKFTKGTAYYDDHYEQSDFDFINSCVFGTCCRKFYVDHEGNPASENVLIENIKFDETQFAMMGGKMPRALHQVSYMDKESIKEKFRVKDINIQTDVFNHRFFDNVLQSGLCRVIEGWKLPSFGKAGRHVITVNGQDLFDEKWTEKDYPFEFFHYSKPIMGFFGTGLSERLLVLQFIIDKLLEDINKTIHLGVPKVFAQIDTVNKNDFNNEIGTLIEYAGITPPIIAQMLQMPKEWFEMLLWYVQQCYQEIGISELGATSQKPAGLSSGKALREYSDIESDRFSIVSQRWEKYHLKCFDKYVWASQVAAKTNPELKFKALDNDGYEVINWNDIKNIKEIDYCMKTYPSNLLSSTPAGRLADIKDLFDIGLVTPDAVAGMLDNPDVKEHLDFIIAPKKFVKKAFDYMLEKGIYMPPDQFMDLNKGIELAVQYINHYRTADVPPPNLVLIEQWVSDAMAMLQKSEDEAIEAEQLAIEQQMEEEQAMKTQNQLEQVSNRRLPETGV